MNFSETRLFSISLIFAVVITSGCISGGDESLSQKFDTDARDVGINSSASSLLNQSFSKDYSRYNVSSELKVLMKTPVAPMRLNLSSSGYFNDSYSNIETRTKIDLGFGTEINKSDQPVKRVETNASRTTVSIVNSENRTGRSFEAYDREDLGLSVEAVKEIGFENGTVLGVTGENSSQILVELEADRSDLLENYAEIFKTHAVNDNSSSMEENDDLSRFENVESYAWIDRDSKKLERFSYYGSAADSRLQVRSDIDFSY